MIISQFYSVFGVFKVRYFYGMSHFQFYRKIIYIIIVILEEMMRQMGGLGAGGAGAGAAAAAAASGAGPQIGTKGYQRPSLDDLDIEDEEDDMPDLE